MEVLGAVAKYFHENLANQVRRHGVGSVELRTRADARARRRLARRRRRPVTAIWDGGLAELQEYVFSDFLRLHIRYKTATWLRGLIIPGPLIRAPMPRPRRAEIARLAELLTACGLEVIGKDVVDETVDRLHLVP